MLNAFCFVSGTRIILTSTENFEDTKLFNHTMEELYKHRTIAHVFFITHQNEVIRQAFMKWSAMHIAVASYCFYADIKLEEKGYDRFAERDNIMTMCADKVLCFTTPNDFKQRKFPLLLRQARNKELPIKFVGKDNVKSKEKSNPTRKRRVR